MHYNFVICQFSIYISGCIVKKVIDAVVNVFPLTYIKICANRLNYTEHGRFDEVGMEEEGANELSEVDDL